MANFYENLDPPAGQAIVADCNAYKRKVARAVAVVDQLQLAGVRLITDHGIEAIQAAMGDDYAELARIHNATDSVIATLTPVEDGE